MKKRLIFLVSFFALTVCLFSQVEVQISTETEWYNGKEYYIHEIQPGETIYSIARVYKVSTESICKVNTFAREVIKPGQLLRVPIVSQTTEKIEKDAEFIVTKTKVETEDSIMLQYLYLVNFYVSENLSLNAIADSFNTDVDFIVNYNKELIEKKKAKKGDLLIVPTKQESAVANYIKNNPLAVVYILQPHRVIKGETLFSISRKYECSVTDIKKFNPGVIESIQENQILYMPATKSLSDILYAVEDISKTSSCVTSEAKQIYNVCVLLPLYLNEIDNIVINDEVLRNKNINFPCFDYIQFYEGFLLGIDSIKVTNSEINIIVYDITDTDKEIRKLINGGAFDNTDLVIGPFFHTPSIILNNYLKNRQTKIVDFSLTNDLTFNSDNPNLLLAIPSVKIQLSELTEFISANYSDKKIYVFYRDIAFERDIVNILKSEFDNTKHINSNFIPYSTDEIKKMCNQLKNSTDSNHLVLNFSNDEVFINEFLRTLFDNSGGIPITLFGLPSWLRFESIDLKYINHFQTHFISSFFIDYSDELTKEFVGKFQEKYHTDPQRWAFLGYDIAVKFLNTLLYYGNVSYECINESRLVGTELLSVDFEFVRITANHIENFFIHIYKVENYETVRLTD